MYALTLIDKARELGNSDATIARRMEISPGNLCDALAGRRKLSPESVALLAAMVGEDAQQAAARQMVENAKEPKRAKLERALFACLVGGVALTTAATDSDALPADLTQYTLSRIRAGIRRALAVLNTALMARGLQPHKA